MREIKMSKNTLAMAVAALVLSGCASAGHKMDPDAISRITKGQTTQAEVTEWLGAPNQTTQDGSGNTTYTYVYVRTTVKASTFIPVAGAFVGGADSQNQVVVVTFDASGVVQNLYSSSGSTDVGTGLAAH